MKERLYPYRTLEGTLEARISNVLVEGTEPRGQVVKTETRTVDLSILSVPQWKGVQFHLEVTGPPEEMKELTDRDSGLSLTAVVSAGPTNARDTFPLTRSTLDPARWVGTIGLDRRNYGAKATLTPILTGGVGGIPHRFLGEADPWTIYFEEPAIPLIEGTLRVKWVDFSHDSAPLAVRKFPNEIFYTELLEDPPILYLNSGFEGLIGLLKDATNRPGAERALHDTVRTAIASAVWMSLLDTAVAGIQEPEDAPASGEESEPDWPTTEWQKTVLRSLLPQIFDERTPSLALRGALDARRSADGMASLQSRAQLVVGQRIKSAMMLRRGLSRLAQEVLE